MEKSWNKPKAAIFEREKRAYEEEVLSDSSVP